MAYSNFIPRSLDYRPKLLAQTDINPGLHAINHYE